MQFYVEINAALWKTGTLHVRSSACPPRYDVRSTTRLWRLASGWSLFINFSNAPDLNAKNLLLLLRQAILPRCQERQIWKLAGTGVRDATILLHMDDRRVTVVYVSFTDY